MKAAVISAWACARTAGSSLAQHESSAEQEVGPLLLPAAALESTSRSRTSFTGDVGPDQEYSGECYSYGIITSKEQAYASLGAAMSVATQALS